MQSFKKKISSLIKNGIDPLTVGIYNFKNTDFDIELLAMERSMICENCVYFKIEPIYFLKVIDKNIPRLTDKMCDECGCTLSYKLRQSLIKCEQWEK